MTNDSQAIIDIGSNSVRYYLNSGRPVKHTKTVRLNNALDQNGFLNFEKSAAAISAVKDFVFAAKAAGVKNIYIFATAAVRNATNRKDFANLIYKETGIKCDILSGEKEALCALYGAFSDSATNSGGVIDIGGASTEIITAKDDKITFLKSFNIGAVSLYKSYKKDRLALELAIENAIVLPQLQDLDFRVIGGTALTIAALELGEYDSEKVHNFRLEQKVLENLTDKLFSLSVDEIERLEGMDKPRADIIGGGALLLLNILKKLNKKYVTVSEKDNLEGYLTLKTRQKL